MRVSKRRMREWVALAVLFPLALWGLSCGLRAFEQAAYPTPYRAWVEQAAQEHGFSPALVYAVIRTESGFRPEAVSHAKARGLMQITEDTFLWAQSRMDGSPSYEAEALHDPEINIRYGVYILSLLREQFGQTDAMLAAYNAGAGRVGEWLQSRVYSPDGVVLTAIPLEETKQYLKKVHEAEDRYRRLYGFS